MSDSLSNLLVEIRACQACTDKLPLAPRPVLSASRTARLLIVGQAPGLRVHETGLAWNDPSGDRLRAWMGVDKALFYDTKQIAILPMGFCYPGKAKSGDLPPQPLCATLWREKLHRQLPNIRLTLLIGQYAQRYYLSNKMLGADQKSFNSVTETVRNWRQYLPGFLPLPHPSPRNNIWLRKHAWFEQEVVPALRQQVAMVLNGQ